MDELVRKGFSAMGLEIQFESEGRVELWHPLSLGHTFKVESTDDGVRAAHKRMRGKLERRQAEIAEAIARLDAGLEQFELRGKTR